MSQTYSRSILTPIARQSVNQMTLWNLSDIKQVTTTIYFLRNSKTLYCTTFTVQGCTSDLMINIRARQHSLCSIDQAKNHKQFCLSGRFFVWR